MYSKSFSFILLIILTSLILLPCWIAVNHASLSYGIMTFSVLVFFITIFISNYKLPLDFIAYFFKTFCAIIFFIILHFLIGYFFEEKNSTRFLMSLLALVIVLFGAAIFSFNLIIFDNKKLLNKTFNVFFYFYLLFGILTFLRFSTYSPVFYKTDIYLTVFSEPSQFAVSLFPFLLFYACTIKSNKLRFFLVLFSLINTFLIGSTAYLLTTLIIIFITFKSKKIIIILITTITVGYFLFIFGYLDIQYYVDRLTLNAQEGSGKPNITSLVYLAGLDETYLNVLSTYSYGIGFQQFGYTGETSDLRDLIYKWSGTFKYLANKDASFLAGKIISEFGIFGIAFLIYYLKLFLQSIITIKKFINNRDNNLIIIFNASCIVALSIELFIRGSGYFTIVTFLFMASMFSNSYINYKHEAKNKYYRLD